MSSTIFSPNHIASFLAPSFTAGGKQSFAEKSMQWVLRQWAAMTASPAKVTPAPMTRFQEAEQVRALAYSVALSDPAFAEDLYCAADRHEFD
jgi:hypothetical protein